MLTQNNFKLTIQFLFIICAIIFLTSCDNDDEPVEPNPIIFHPPPPPKTGFLPWPPESCDIREGRLPLYRSRDGNFEFGVYGRAPDPFLDRPPEGGIFGRITFKKPSRTTREINDSSSEPKYIGVMGGIYFKGYPFEGITTIGGIAISGLPHNISLRGAKIRFADSDEISFEIKSIEEIIPSLMGTGDFSQVIVIVPTNPNILTFSSESETSLDFIFWFELPLEENEIPLFNVNVIPLLINEEQEYRVVSPQRVELVKVNLDETSNLPSNLEVFTPLSDSCVRCKLSAELTYFNANYNDNDDKILFEWKSGVETDNAGFNIWCAKKDSIEKPFKINDVVIASNAISFGNNYYSKRYLRKNSGLDSGTQYCAIETIDNNGLCNIHCDLITEATINGNKYPSSNNELAVSEVRSSCEAYKVLSEKIYGTGMCLDRLLRD